MEASELTETRVQWETDGWSELRDRVRFIDFESEFLEFVLEVYDKEEEQGAKWDYLPLAKHGRTTVDLVPAWWKSAGVDTAMDGSITLPSELTERRCWGEGENRRCESWEDVLDRLEPLLSRLGYVIDGSHYWVPGEAWREAVR